MSPLQLFKFRDLTDDNVAFVISDDLQKARALLKEETTLEFTTENTMLLEDIPAALEHYGHQGESIYLNHIMPF